MKKIILITSLIGVFGFAEEQNQNIEKIKEKIIELNQKRITIIQEENNCVKNSNSKESLKKCKIQAREYMSQIKEEHFKNIKEKESSSHSKRINILNKAEKCINKAKNPEEYRQCEQEERNERKELI